VIAVHLLAALSWDPQLRGALIVLTGVLVLMGSVYLLLATNVGAKVGFLLALAGLSGWLLVLNVIWLMGPLGNGPIGYKGVAGGWRIKEIIPAGDVAEHSVVAAVTGAGNPANRFPNGWKPLVPGTPLLASAQPAADAALLPPANGAKATSSFPAPFKTPSDYVPVGAFVKGGHNYLVNLFGYKIYWRIRHHQIYLKHQPRFLIIRVQPSLPSVTLAGAAATLPAPNVTAPITTVVMERDYGSLRLPPTLLGLASFLLFALTCERLHHRDKEIARIRGTGGPSGRRELQPA